MTRVDDVATQFTKSQVKLSALKHRKPQSAGSETALVQACLIWLKTQGAMVWRANTGAMTLRAPGQRSRFVRFGPVGQPDIVGYGPPPIGRGIAVECKRHPNILTWAQRQFLEEAEAHGAFAVCVWSVEELEQAWKTQMAGVSSSQS